MKKIVIIAAQLLFAGIVFSQDAPAKYAVHINTENLRKHLAVIASEEMEGRETGTEGQRKAAAYIEAQFKLMGLKSPDSLNGYQQFFPLYRDSMTKCTVKINGKELDYGTDYYVPVLNNDSRKISVSKFVFAGYGISEKDYDDYKEIGVRGKVAVIFLGEPKTDGKSLLTKTKRSSRMTFPGLSEKIELAEKKGASAVVVLNPAIGGISSYTVLVNSKSNVYYPGKARDKGIGYIGISHEAAKRAFKSWNIDSLAALAKTGSFLQAASVPVINTRFSFNYTKERQVVYASNVLGIIEGTDKKDEFVFLTAHYDHLGKKDNKIYYGADDDGSGTSAVLNMAEAFLQAKAEGHGPRRTVVFMTVSGEEKGLWGSEYYSDHPVFPLDKTSVDLNIDMVGRTDTERKKDDTLNYIYVIGHDKISSDLQPINETVNKQYTGLVLDYKYDDPNDREQIYYRSDHYNFARKGVPILFFYDGMLKADYHKPTDTIDKINWELYQKRVRMIFHTAWQMANRDEMLERDLPLPGEE